LQKMERKCGGEMETGVKEVRTAAMRIPQNGESLQRENKERFVGNVFLPM